MTHEDVLWSLRLSLITESMYVVEEVTYLYYKRDTSVSGSEKWIDEVRAYIHILPLMVDVFNRRPKKVKDKDKYHFFDFIFERRYGFCFLDHMKEEYIELRTLDPRPASWIVKNGIKSLSYMRRHLHRLMPVKIALIRLMRYNRLYHEKTTNNFRSIHGQTCN